MSDVDRPLRIGLLLDGLDVAAWQFSAIAQIAALDCAEIALAALNEQPPHPRGFGAVIRQNWREAGYFLFDKLDRRLFSRQPDAFAPKNLKTLLADIPVIQSQEPARIAERRLDILVHFGAEKPSAKLALAARWGVWTYHFGEANSPGNAPPGFWETAENREVTGVALQMLGGMQEGMTILHQSWFPTYPFSPAMNRQLHLWTASTFMAREIARLHALGENAFFRRVAAPASPDLSPGPGLPGNFDVIKTALRLIYRILRRKINDLRFREQWVMLYQFQDDDDRAFRSFRRISSPPQRYWADPQILQQEHRHAILFEDYEYKTDKGRIAVIEVDEAGKPSDPTVILNKDYHLSYPFAFSWQNRLYMIPESAQNRSIDLYECIEFPDKWRFKMRLMQDIRAADATLLRHNDKWWLFAAVSTIEGSSLNYELFLFFADDFATTAWTPHPLNPIVSDVRRARPAGSIFRREGKIIRPAQNSARGYGRSITFNEIITLTETDYEERPMAALLPDWDKNVIGVHTFQRRGRLTVIDALERRPKWRR